MTPNDLFKLRHYLAKKEKAGQIQDTGMARGRKKDHNDDLEVSDNDNKDKPKSTKNDGSTLKYQKEASHCLETNKYVVPRKI